MSLQQHVGDSKFRNTICAESYFNGIQILNENPPMVAVLIDSFP